MSDELSDPIRELTPTISRSGTEIRLTCDTSEDADRIWDALWRDIDRKVSPEIPIDTRIPDLESRIKRLEAWTFGRWVFSKPVITVYEHGNPDKVAGVVNVNLDITEFATKGSVE